LSNGVLFVVFGERFYNLAMKTIKHSRKFTELPICVLTNIKNNEFERIENTSYIYINRPDCENRFVKTNMINYTPFDTTIYIDCDAVIQKEGVEQVIDMVDGFDLLFEVYGTWTNQTKALSYYRITMSVLNVEFPLMLYYGAFIVFNKTEKAYKFFREWHENWIRAGVAREMPALACTAKLNPDVNINKMMLSKNIFSWKINPYAAVQHEYGNGDMFWNNFFKRCN